MEEQNKNTSLTKRENLSLARVSKTLDITKKLLSASNKLAIATYKSVIIGAQEWMVENLNMSHFRNGEIIPEARTVQEWKEAGEKKQPAWCYYDNDPENGKIYGKLYNWYAVNDIRNICPSGWHVPSDNEWRILKDYLGGDSVAGDKMKENGTVHWKSPNKSVNNSGFTALPGGLFNSHSKFVNIEHYGLWWSFTEFNTNSALYQDIYYNSSNVNSDDCLKSNGISVRCIKDY